MFKSIPFFASLGRTALGKFSYFFSETKYIRGSYIFKEQEVAQYIYIIKSGEFEMLKNCKVTQEAYNHVNKLDNQGKVTDSSWQEYYKNQRCKSAKNNSKMISVAIMTQGQMFGEHELILGNKNNKK